MGWMVPLGGIEVGGNNSDPRPRPVAGGETKGLERVRKVPTGC